jgi:hypothetical protein|nr:MAG TPA: hypothetical protein [Caudoviricetes sp.]
MTRITTTVETVSITDIKEGDTLLDGDGERIVVKTITSCSPHRLRYQDAEGENRCVLLDCVLRVVPEEPTEEETAEEEPVWPDADLIRIIRGTENGNRIDGSLAYRIDGEHGFRLLDGPRVEYAVVHGFPSDAIFEWEEVVPVAKSAILASLGTTDDEPEDDDTDDVDGEEETEDEDECDGSCLACILMRLLTAAAAGKDKEGEE